MTPAEAGRGHQLLLIEPSSMVRGIVVSVARELQLAQVHQTGSLSTATQWLGARHMDGIFMSLHDPAAALTLLDQLRSQSLLCAADVPVVAMLPQGDDRWLEPLRERAVRRVLPLPFRIREVIDAMYALWPHAVRRPA